MSVPEPTDAELDREYLVDWYGRKANLARRGRVDADLYRRVGDALRGETESLYADLVDEIEGRAPATPGFILLPEDITILAVLAEAGHALTVAQIVQLSAGMYRQEVKECRRPAFASVAETAVKKRLPYLLKAGLLARPQGRKARTVGITPPGQQALKKALRK
jgi:hypothetical protein